MITNKHFLFIKALSNKLKLRASFRITFTFYKTLTALKTYNINYSEDKIKQKLKTKSVINHFTHLNYIAILSKLHIIRYITIFKLNALFEY